MIPVRDENPLVRKPIANVCVIGINIAAWIFIQGMGDPVSLARSFCLFALIPGDLLGQVPPDKVISLDSGVACNLGVNTNLITPIYSMFLHGGWFHIIGNMRFLWIFGDNIEDSMGIVRFVIFYLLCGLVAAAAQIMTNPASVIPMPAVAMLGYWFILQLVGGIPALSGSEGGVAFWAHVGGFVAGLLLVGPLHRPDYLTAHGNRRPRKNSRYRLF